MEAPTRPLSDQASGPAPIATFSRVWSTLPGALVDAGASAREWAVLVALMRFQNEGARLSRPVSAIAEECHIRPDVARRALSSLTRRTFLDAQGVPTPVLTRLRAGGLGHVAAYRLNVPRLRT